MQRVKASPMTLRTLLLTLLFAFPLSTSLCFPASPQQDEVQGAGAVLPEQGEDPDQSMQSSLQGGSAVLNPEAGLRLGVEDPLRVELLTKEEQGLRPAEIAAIVSPLVVLIVALIGWFVNNKNLDKQLAHSREVLEQELAAERDARRIDRRLDTLRERESALSERLFEFYIPFDQLSDTNKRLADTLKRRREPDQHYRALTKLLEDRGFFDENDMALLGEIVNIGGELSTMIRDHAGHIDTPELHQVFARASEHFRVFKLAYEKKLAGEAASFERHVYPLELDEMIKSRIDALRTEMANLKAEMNDLTQERKRVKAARERSGEG